MESTLKDSKKNRSRIVAFLLSKNGYVSSGRNDNLVGWLFHQVAVESYAHERVGELKSTLLAMADDGELLIEWSQKGRVMSLTVTDGARIEIDSESRQFFDTNEALWGLVNRLTSQRDIACRQLEETEKAFDELEVDAVLPERLAELEETIRRYEGHDCEQVCTHDAEMDRLERRLVDSGRAKNQALATLAAEYEVRIERILSTHEKSMDGLVDRLAGELSLIVARGIGEPLEVVKSQIGKDLQLAMSRL